MPDEEAVLVRIQRGELSGRQVIVPASVLGGWPLPDRLVFTALGDQLGVLPEAFEDLAINPDTGEMQDGFLAHKKVSQSGLTDEQAREATCMMRGALYAPEDPDAA